MAIKKEMKAWAIKLRGRSFCQSIDGIPFFYMTKKDASTIAMLIVDVRGTPAEAVRVKIKVEEV